MPESVRVHDVEPGLFEALGVLTRWGRPFGSDDALPGREPVAALREDFARTLFGDPLAAIGQRVETADGSFRVVGVMPPGFRFPTAIEKIWRPLVPPPQDRDRSKQVVAVLAEAARASTVSAMVASLVNADHKPGDEVGPVTAVPMSSAHKDPRALTNSGAFTSFDAPRLFTTLIGVVICLAGIVGSTSQGCRSHPRSSGCASIRCRPRSAPPAPRSFARRSSRARSRPWRAPPEVWWWRSPVRRRSRPRCRRRSAAFSRIRSTSICGRSSSWRSSRALG